MLFEVDVDHKYKLVRRFVYFVPKRIASIFISLDFIKCMGSDIALIL